MKGNTTEVINTQLNSNLVFGQNTDWINLGLALLFLIKLLILFKHPKLFKILFKELLCIKELGKVFHSSTNADSWAQNLEIPVGRNKNNFLIKF